jgi:hypothetical protein
MTSFSALWNRTNILTKFVCFKTSGRNSASGSILIGWLDLSERLSSSLYDVSQHIDRNHRSLKKSNYVLLIRPTLAKKPDKTKLCTIDSCHFGVPLWRATLACHVGLSCTYFLTCLLLYISKRKRQLLDHLVCRRPRHLIKRTTTDDRRTTPGAPNRRTSSHPLHLVCRTI